MNATQSGKPDNLAKANGSKLAHARRSAPAGGQGLRVSEARHISERSEEVLGKLRDLLTGPQQKLAEARYGEMIDILEEQDVSQQQNFRLLSGQINELASGIGKLKQAFSDLQALYEKANARHDQQMSELRDHVERALAAHADDMNARFRSLNENSLENLNTALATARRDLEQLSSVVDEHKTATATGFENLKANSLSALDQRLAQWRAEREDERVDDLKAVANSFLDIGQRLAELRRNSFTVS